jgi:hypothetical protein
VHNLFERGFFGPSSTSSREEEDDPYEEEQDFGTFETSDETTAEMVGLVTKEGLFFCLHRMTTAVVMTFRL